MQRFHNAFVAALWLLLCFAPMAMAADQARTASLLDRLAAAKDAAEAGRIESELDLEWAKSGSAAMDLLYQRGADALELGDARTAAEHFTAIIDHAPGFIAAWDGRAGAYYMAGETGPALADLAHVLTVEPRFYSALSGLATILEETNRPEAALGAWRAVLEIHPFMPPAKEAITRLSRSLEGEEL